MDGSRGIGEGGSGSVLSIDGGEERGSRFDRGAEGPH